MNIIEKKAQLIAEEMGAPKMEDPPADPKAPAPTPSPIGGTIISVILALLKAFGACGVPAAKAAKRMRNPGRVYQRSLMRTIQQEVDNPALWEPMFAASLKVGHATTDPEAQEMFNIAQNHP